jgi:hypothetical protein
MACTVIMGKPFSQNRLVASWRKSWKVSPTIPVHRSSRRQTKPNTWPLAFKELANRIAWTRMYAFRGCHDRRNAPTVSEMHILPAF